MSTLQKPLVYACSGCSNVAQLANDMAVIMDREGIAEMSCIAGVGGGVRPLVDTAKSGRPILAIDGCPLACVKQSLAQHQVEPNWHLELTRLGLKKRNGEDCNGAERHRALSEAYRLLKIIPIVNIA
jgi:uncharacterized metal-binding protein